ncbi:MAG TPA: sulfite exporter TauE/SafE family protein [Acidobacteriaceae bacterium]|nr:sulfite exporter TauE/SafE family protein [Acidobacteriaceae bacterium]
MEVLIGFVIAVVIALTGVGAGVITAPLLILFMHVPIEIAVSTALAYSAVVKLIVVPVQIWRKQVAYRLLGTMLLGGLPGVILGSLLFKRVALEGPKSILYGVLGAIIIVSSGWHIYRYFFPSAIHRPRADRPRWITAIMMFIGAEVGFSSSGAGALGTIALLSLTSLSASQVVGTDLTFGLGIALAGTGVHILGGAYNLGLLLKLAAGGVLGGVFGSYAAPAIPNRQLRLALSVWLLAIGLEFCYQAAHLGVVALASSGLNALFLR